MGKTFMEIKIAIANTNKSHLSLQSSETVCYYLRMLFQLLRICTEIVNMVINWEKWATWGLLYCILPLHFQNEK
jgi:hypothetical protein